ncbi:MAG TPA: hypothetical protein VFO10_11620 [Oligoflexus sp.]|uniref:hypothetical protein n=1 Tax=Oligoflexus sp. TaxID=1971216 RepID=UPI002D7F3925|nr:hypothetical protein [Oligoflexus sp.]HET9237895.1 hypothetical protein [Oligoflexus sp.]
MRFRHVVILFGLFFIACKTTSEEAPRPAAPIPAVQSEETTPSVEPSPALQSTPNLVTPGSDEVLIRRGPGARCPNAVELDEIEQAVQTLGRDTINLVDGDLKNLRKTSSRNDRDGISSCCNQLEQLAQDVEIMNEDKAAATPYTQRIRSLTLQLCPPAE